jgi:hypothetical protein
MLQQIPFTPYCHRFTLNVTMEKIEAVPQYQILEPAHPEEKRRAVNIQGRSGVCFVSEKS